MSECRCDAMSRDLMAIYVKTIALLGTATNSSGVVKFPTEFLLELAELSRKSAGEVA